MTAPQHPTPQYPTPTPANYNAAPPLWAPYYGAPFKDAVQRVFKKYATFSGRASRAEYWWWALVGAVVGIVLNIIISAGMVASTSTYSGYAYSAPTLGPVSIIGVILAVVWGLAIIVPTLALAVRRLHDVNMSGWMVLIGLVPFVGGIALLVFMLLPPKPEGQRFDQPVAPAYGR
ncbi:uncharacterized membrane protein YhaH (DUF805 family) [Sinomonas atrocyanea]|uniref:DUF805 domain-containing protein n=1 Tax=Sinomonas atrocyanea TaxID=37927 RepID=UPI002783AA45|nr:DUF805 domain-containing protein [Sinomonas atrocyanea]MDP9885901.1 uncharacterized membrane protein YhaH (DUF805 family) [Sinomonas atrocyanea]